jgi:uncharacterized protein YjbI with pentapeptide repeats
VAKPDHLAKLFEGVDAWNRWRVYSPDDLPDLRGADLSSANLRNFNFTQADLRGVDLTRADVSDADISRATLVNANLYRAKLNRVTGTGADLTDCDIRRARFIGADLRGVNMTRAKARRVRLQQANLSHAVFKGTDLAGAILASATLVEANLSRAIMTDADLTKADITRAKLSRSILQHVCLSGADLSRSRWFNTIVSDVDLGVAIGLASTEHFGPSRLDTRTFELSGALPLSFLRGCGISETFITFLPSLLHEPIQFYSLFISYSSTDQPFASRLHADLQQKGVRCWFAPHDVQGGKKLHDQIDEAIRLHDRLLLILSEASMSSEWVKTEIAKARKREIREHRRVLFPVGLVNYERLREWECFDVDTGKDNAREIREYFIPDFSGWKDHDVYKVAFERLIRDLKNNPLKDVANK